MSERKYKRGDERYRRDDEMRRIMETALQRLLWGDDSWSEGLKEMFSYAVLLAFVAIVLGWLTGNQAHGDLIIEVDYIDVTVYHESYGVVDEVGINLTGKDRPLGWIYFWQPETLCGDGPGVEFGGYAERYGGSTQQSLQFYADSNGYLQTGLYGDRFTGSAASLVSSGYLRADMLIPLGHSAVYLPFVWSSHADQFGDDEPDTLYTGTGWISFTAFDQSPPAGQPASFTIGEVLLTSADSYVGQRVFSQAVPEPEAWGLFVLVCCAVILYKRRRQ